MKQAVLEKPGTIIIQEVERPVFNENQVLLEIKIIGICGSDIHAYHGKHPYVSYPLVQGHEFSGIIKDAGKNVTGLTIGKRATLRPQIVCGECYPCTHGQSHICDNLKVVGFQTPGAAAEYFVADKELVIPLPDTLSAEAGAFVEPLSVGIHGLNRAGFQSGMRIWIIGAGPIGNLMAQAALAQGAEKVLITDILDWRLKIAQKSGIAYTINPHKVDMGEYLNNLFGPDKADLICECVGSQASMDQAVTFARKGSHILVTGVFGDKPAVDLGLVQDRELKLIGTLMYQHDDYLKAIELLAAGQIQWLPLISRIFPFDDYHKAYEYIDNHREETMKVMIELKNE